MRQTHGLAVLVVTLACSAGGASPDGPGAIPDARLAADAGPADARPPDGPVPDAQPADAARMDANLNPRIVYINFDGVTLTGTIATDDATQNLSRLVANGQTRDLPASFYTQAERDQLLAALNVTYLPYNVNLVTTRPASGTYDMVIVYECDLSSLCGTASPKWRCCW